MDQKTGSDKAPPLTPQELFAKCEEDEKQTKLYGPALEFVTALYAGDLTFTQKLFKADPELDPVLEPDSSDDFKMQMLIRDARRYRHVVDWLKELKSREERWILLAVWLSEEEICHPMNFLPPKMYKKVTDEKRQSIAFSPSDGEHYRRVEAWRPYFERLIADRKTMGEAKLTKAGFDESAIGTAHGKRFAISAACAFLAARNGPDGPDETTLRNAYSRVSKRHKIADGSL